MRTKEVIMRIEQIVDFRNEMNKSNQDDHMKQALLMSTNNTKAKLVSLIKKMQEKGLWLTYKRLEKESWT